LHDVHHAGCSKVSDLFKAMCDGRFSRHPILGSSPWTGLPSGRSGAEGNGRPEDTGGYATCRCQGDHRQLADGRRPKRRTEVTYRNSFITDLPLSRDNVADIAVCDRARWKMKIQYSEDQRRSPGT
jgi:hypothetical protein